MNDRLDAATPWELAGAEGEAILGDAHLPCDAPRGTLVICHGSMGYKDYGMLPRVAEAAAAMGWAAHRFNFSHSGMTRAIERFERPDLYRVDTWRKQAFDLRAVLRAVGSGELPGGGPVAVFGHSRGGVTALLTARWMLDEGDAARPDGLVTAAAPAELMRLSEDDIAQAKRDGVLPRKSNRTGQALEMDRLWIDEQEADPAWHDALAAGERVCDAGLAWLILHGEADATVPIDEGRRYLERSGGRAQWLAFPGANHVFDCPNPPPSGPLPDATRGVIDATTEFCAALRSS
ncbi:MAG: alpha/beta fold hydrolase [Planctomycetota bacterium]